MDPAQELCLGALFDIAATNVCKYIPFLLQLNTIDTTGIYPTVFKCQGLDMGRRLCIYGFCRSVEMLSDVVEDTVLEYGGEVCVETSLSISEHFLSHSS